LSITAKPDTPPATIEAGCKNKLMEKKLYVQYLEQKEKKQIEYEDICLRFIHKEILPQMPAELIPCGTTMFMQMILMMTAL
jgi:hypothetical protein